MDQRLTQAIRTRGTLKDLAQLEDNVQRVAQMTDEVRAALDERSGELARGLVAERTGLDFATLTAAEEKIVSVTAKYVGIKIRTGTNANRTIAQLKNRGLIGAAEAAVSGGKTTLGFQTLNEAGLLDLSYEQIVTEHPEEFSEAAVWYARRTLGLPNLSGKPPQVSSTRVTRQQKSNLELDQTSTASADRYWVFVCNPKKWAIDRFLMQRTEQDTWGVRPSDRQHFAPGQLGIIRVGVDRRNVAERGGTPPLSAGVYAICEVESTAFDGTGAADEFWAPEEARGPGWPTVKLRYLKTFLNGPLTIEAIKKRAPDLSPLLLDGFQASSFPIPADDFRRIVELLGERLEELGDSTTPEPRSAADVTALEERYLRASPEVKERVGRVIERGPVGGWAKKVNAYRCQVCAALGFDALGFRKRGGELYVEAHHVMPVSRGEVGSLALSNIMTVCANHHRQLHYGDVRVAITPLSFEVAIDGAELTISRLAKSSEATES